ncbi:MAG: hypothetical protein DHS20C16_34770 [Phycisphaerae bacterium]|nr:MAG: hypothetical protein DHS20C16_34770 [Phycisphaerae bacterium]
MSGRCAGLPQQDIGSFTDAFKMAYCDYCSTKNAPKASFCKNCGKEMPDWQVWKSSGPAILFWILFVAGLLLVIGIMQ